MKGNEQILAKLNDQLADELTAINQYMVHSEMCDNWGYGRLHKKIEERAIVEMKQRLGAQKGRLHALVNNAAISRKAKAAAGSALSARGWKTGRRCSRSISSRRSCWRAG